MNREEITNIFFKEDSPLVISHWLRTNYFPEIITRFNQESTRKYLGLYKGEKMPTNERNLTDVRTRMGLLIEFEIARISNILLEEYGIEDYYWSYVVANKFPDLEIRNCNGERSLRFEVKCLQSIAEEKAPNFKTLLKDIDCGTDFIVVCLWDWSSDGFIKCQLDRAPQIEDIFVFHAYSLALLRNTYWLNTPPKKIGDEHQGFDIRNAITYSNGKYSKEQGNYGKFTRIWTKGFKYRCENQFISKTLIEETEREYLSFLNIILIHGFNLIAKRHLEELSNEAVEYIELSNNIRAYISGYYAYLISLQSSININTIKKVFSQYNIKIAVAMTGKYKCSIFTYREGQPIKETSGVKPKNVVEIIKNIIV